MRTHSSPETMTRHDKIVGWSFGATLVIVLPALIVIAHAMSGR